MQFFTFLAQAAHGVYYRMIFLLGRLFIARFCHWENLGIWEEMNTLLRKQWRVKQGRNENPTGGIIDSQSVKTTEKGGSKDMTELKKLKDEKGIYWWIHKEFCSQLA